MSQAKYNPNRKAKKSDFNSNIPVTFTDNCEYITSDECATKQELVDALIAQTIKELNK